MLTGRWPLEVVADGYAAVGMISESRRSVKPFSVTNE